jgi:hypothetical protein
VKKKKLYRYIKLESAKEFPATKARKEFRLPWRVKGAGLKEKLV